MDYLGWELERQREALAALLLGGREIRDGEPTRGGTRQGDTAIPEPDAGSGQQALGAWEARQRRESARAGVVEAPVSAWEAVLGGEEVWAVRQDRENGGAGTTETPVSTWTILGGEANGRINSEKAAWLRRSGGTGAPPESPRPSGGYPARRGIRRIEADLTAQTQAAPAESGGDGAVSSEARAKQDRTTESTVAAKYPAPFFIVRRGGGSTADALTEDGPAAAGSVSWGRWGAAALRAEDSAKSLSRAVQRDARRYDGGFNIF